MKFLPENRKKTIFAGVILVVSIGATVYLNFFYGKEPAEPVLVPSPTFSEELGQNPAAAPSTPSALLPYGPKIDTSVLEQDKFKALRSAPRVQVRSDELGKTNPFSR